MEGQPGSPLLQLHISSSHFGFKKGTGFCNPWTEKGRPPDAEQGVSIEALRQGNGIKHCDLFAVDL